LPDPHLAKKLESCFEKVFPNLPKSAIPNATNDNVREWDSIAQVTLVTLIGEEFAIDIDFEEFVGATSFTSLLEAVRQKTVNEQQSHPPSHRLRS
jgi:acyl carrier protein